MNHAPVHTIGLPSTPEAEQELPLIEEVTRNAGALVLVNAETADFFIKRYGRLPANCEVYVVGTAPAPAGMPMLRDVIDNLRDMWPERLLEEGGDEELPAIRAQSIKPMRQRPGAQWKRERNGRPTR